MAIENLSATLPLPADEPMEILRKAALLGVDVSDVVAARILADPKASYSERTEKCVGGKRVTNRVWESASLGYQVHETVSYAHPYDHPAWRRQSETSRQVVRLRG